jgi:hypothetical protein
LLVAERVVPEDALSIRRRAGTSIHRRFVVVTAAGDRDQNE